MIAETRLLWALLAFVILASMRPRSNDRGNSLYRKQLIFNKLAGQMRAATSQTPEFESFTDPSYV